MNTVTNAEFLARIFSELRPEEYLWKTAFKVCPNDAKGEWGGRKIETPCPDHRGKNAYFCVAALRPAEGESRRTKKNFSRLFCVVLDDVGDCDLIPTWRLRTSEGKCQIGFKLDVPIDCVDIAERIHKALGRGGRIAADRNGNNPVRYVRLPVQTNTKSSYPKPFDSVLESFDPSMTHSLDSIIEVLGLDANYICDGDESIRATSVPKSSPANVAADVNANEHEADAELVRLVMTAESYHEPLLKLTARYAQRGMDAHSITELVQGLMLSGEDRSSRWQSRFDAIPRMVQEAVRKYAKPKVLRESFKVLSGAELCNAPPMRWMVRGVLPMEGLAALYGPSGSGKSFLALDMAASIADDVFDWFGYRMTQCPVTYCALEGETGMGKRVKAWSTHHKKRVPSALRFVTQSFDLQNTIDVAELSEAIKTASGDGGLVILDTLNRAAPGADENSSVDMGNLIAAAKRLQELLGGLVLLVHHTGKDSTKGLRGHSSLYAALDAAIEVNKTDTRREWRVAKSKDDETGRVYPFDLVVVPVGLDEDKLEITSCVCVPDVSANAIKQVKLPAGGNQKIAFDTLADLLHKSVDFDKDGAPPGQACIHLEDAVRLVAERLTCEPKRRTERARSAITALVGSRICGLKGDWLWRP